MSMQKEQKKALKILLSLLLILGLMLLPDYTTASQLPPKTSDTSLSALHQEKLEEIQGLRNKGDLTDAFQMESWTLLMYAVAMERYDRAAG